MGVREAVVIAMHSMRTARLRTLLTAAGIVLGVAAVIVLIGLGTGMRTGFNAKFGAMSTSITVSKTNQAEPGGNSVKSLTESDIVALTRPGAAPSVAEVTPLRNGAALISYEDRDYRASLAGTTPNYLAVRNRSILAGSMFTEQDNRDRARVVVLGTRVVRYLFDGDVVKALNSNVRVGRLTMRVVGVLASGGEDLDGVGVVPLNSSRALFAGGTNLNGIGVLATDVNSVPAATAQVNRILDEQHGITEPGQRDYNTTQMVAQLYQVNGFIDLLQRFTLAVAGVALFVGALGLGNIMVVTVAERTSEIGIRKAIGARRAAIMKQFLVESMSVSGVGGVGGVLLGIVLVLVGREVMPRVLPGMGSPELSVLGVAVAFAVSLVIGLLAGCYPAYRASRMHPVDALGY
jgi:putative ABC transport system permease protein